MSVLLREGFGPERKRFHSHLHSKAVATTARACMFYSLPLAQDFAPTPESVIDYRALGSPEALGALLNK